MVSYLIVSHGIVLYRIASSRIVPFTWCRLIRIPLAQLCNASPIGPGICVWKGPARSTGAVCAPREVPNVLLLRASLSTSYAQSLY